ncbi:MAG: HNH endonuclease signature motif containing protein [Candidatus Nitrosopolaris sp.]
MNRTKNRTNVMHVVLGVLISSMLLLTSVLEKQNLSALTSGDRYTSGFSHGEQQAATDFQNNSTFNPVCVKHTSYYCTGYLKGYSVTWNNLSAKRSTSNPNLNPPADNSSSPYTPNSNKTVAKPSRVISSSTDNWISQFIIFVIVVLIVAAIASKLKHRKGKYKERKDFSDDVKEKRLGKQHHRCADCNRVLNVVDWHHKNGNRSDNKESNCVALCPNCHAVRTRAHR